MVKRGAVQWQTPFEVVMKQEKEFVITATMVLRAIFVFTLAVSIFNLVIHLRYGGTFITFFEGQELLILGLVLMSPGLLMDCFRRKKNTRNAKNAPPMNNVKIT